MRIPIASLPQELLAHITDVVADTAKHEAVQRHGPGMDNGAKAAARALASLMQINKSFSQHALAFHARTRSSETSKFATRFAIQDTATKIDEPREFEDFFVKLIGRYEHIEIPFAYLSEIQTGIVLTHLKKKLGGMQTLHMGFDNFKEFPVLTANQIVHHILEVNALAHAKLNIGFFLQSVTVDPQHIDQLASALRSQENRFVECGFGNCGLLETDVASLAAAFSSPHCKITKCSFAGNDLGDDAVAHLATAFLNPDCKISRCDLSVNEIDNDGVIALANAFMNPKTRLTSCDLHGNQFDSGAVVHLADAFKSPHNRIASCDLSGNSLDGDAIEHLAQALGHANCRITRCDLGETEMNDEGVGRLATALAEKNCKVTSLDLSNNSITAEGLLFLGGALIKPDCPVTHCSVRSNPCDPDAARNFSELVKRASKVHVEY